MLSTLSDLFTLVKHGKVARGMRRAELMTYPVAADVKVAPLLVAFCDVSPRPKMADTRVPSVSSSRGMSNDVATFSDSSRCHFLSFYTPCGSLAFSGGVCP